MASLPEHAWALINDEEESSTDKTLADEEESRATNQIQYGRVSILYARLSDA